MQQSQIHESIYQVSGLTTNEIKFKEGKPVEAQQPKLFDIPFPCVYVCVHRCVCLKRQTCMIISPFQNEALSDWFNEGLFKAGMNKMHSQPETKITKQTNTKTGNCWERGGWLVYALWIKGRKIFILVFTNDYIYKIAVIKIIN